MESSKLGLQRQAHRTVCSGDVHPRHALETSLYFVGIKPRTFEDLATRAHDMELSIANRGTKDFLVSEVKKGNNEINDTRKIINSVINKSTVVHKSPLKYFSKRKETKIERKHDGKEKHEPTLKERQEKLYPFPDFDVETC